LIARVGCQFLSLNNGFLAFDCEFLDIHKVACFGFNVSVKKKTKPIFRKKSQKKLKETK
jgi:hypothetical protein